MASPDLGPVSLSLDPPSAGTRADASRALSARGGAAGPLDDPPAAAAAAAELEAATEAASAEKPRKAALILVDVKPDFCGPLSMNLAMRSSSGDPAMRSSSGDPAGHSSSGDPAMRSSSGDPAVRSSSGDAAPTTPSTLSATPLAAHEDRKRYKFFNPRGFQGLSRVLRSKAHSSSEPRPLGGSGGGGGGGGGGDNGGGGDIGGDARFEERAAPADPVDRGAFDGSAAVAAEGFRGPTADSAKGELLIDVAPIVCASGFGLDMRPVRHICGETFRLGARRADGSLDRAGFLGGAADMIKRSLEMQAPWLEAARAQPRERFRGVEGTTQLMRAAADEGAGAVQRVRELAAAGAQLCAVDAGGASALHYAARRKDGGARMLEALLALGPQPADVMDASDALGATPLTLACAAGCEAAVRVLLARGSSLAQKGEGGSTPLASACKRGHAAVADLLLRTEAADAAAAGTAAGTGAGALDEPDDSGSTPLHDGARNGHAEVVRLLLARGASQLKRTRMTWTAMHSAVNAAKPSTLALLCAAADAAAAMAMRTADGHTPLELAAAHRYDGRSDLRAARSGAARELARARADCESVLRSFGAGAQ